MILSCDTRIRESALSDFLILTKTVIVKSTDDEQSAKTYMRREKQTEGTIEETVEPYLLMEHYIEKNPEGQGDNR